MRPAPFALLFPEDVAEAVQLLSALGPDAKILAGGQTLMPLLNRRVLRPTALIDVTRLAGHRSATVSGGALRLGALCTHDQIGRLRDPEFTVGFEVLPRSAGLIAHHPIRTRGTIGGSLAYALATSEWCLLAVLLDAEIGIAGVGGRRTVPAAEYFRPDGSTALGQAELITDVEFGQPEPTAALLEHTVRKGDYALALAGAAVTLDGGRLSRVRLAVARADRPPARLRELEEQLTGLAVGAGLSARVSDGVERLLAGAGNEPHYLDTVCATLAGRVLTESIHRASELPTLTRTGL